MRVLVDANLPRRTADLIRGLGHDATDVRNIGLGAADDEKIAALARSERMVLLSRDYDFADTRNYPPEDYAGIVVVDLPKDAGAEMILRVVANFFSRQEFASRVPGRLAIVALGRVRFRPA